MTRWLQHWLAEPCAPLTPTLQYLLLQRLNSNSEELAGPAGHERLKQQFFRLLRKASPTIFCDIGAHDGQTAAQVRALSASTVYAFEANPDVYRHFRASPALAGVAYLNLAISDRDGTSTMYAPRTLSKAYTGGRLIDAAIVEPTLTGKTSLRRRNEEATYGEYRVPARSLDSFFFSRYDTLDGHHFALWIDAEGAADRVLAGASEVLRRTALIFIEVETQPFWQDQATGAAISKILMGKGFVPVARDREYDDAQFNVIFVHQDWLLRLYDELFNASPPEDHVPPAAAPLPPPSAPSPRSHLLADMPIFVPCFNNPTYIKRMVDQLQRFELRNIVLIDNASNYPPLLSYLASVGDGVTVVREADNKGPRFLLEDPKIFSLLPNYFCLTDPDLEFNRDLPRDFLARLAETTEEFKVGKAGFSLDISDRELMIQDEFVIGGKPYKIWDWEAQFWTNQLRERPDPIYRASIDTTFAVYNKKYLDPATFYDGVRMAGRYTCRHLPWYRARCIPPEEEAHYRAASKFSYYMSAGPATA